MFMMMALVPLVVSDYDRPNERTKRGGELDGRRKCNNYNDNDNMIMIMMLIIGIDSLIGGIRL